MAEMRTKLRLGSAPDLDVTFPDPADREAARNLMDLMGRVEES